VILFQKISRALLLCLSFLALVPTAQAAQAELLDVMQTELQRMYAGLDSASEAPLYFLQYSVSERSAYSVSSIDGGMRDPRTSHSRSLDVDVRVGSDQLDNTHEIRGGNWRDNYFPRRDVSFPIENDPAAMRASLWQETEFQYREAQERLTKVITNRKVKVEEEDLSADFSPATPQVDVQVFTTTPFDTLRWVGIIRRLGDYFAGIPSIIGSGASLNVSDQTDNLVNSEGSRIRQFRRYIVLGLSVRGMAADGMSLERSENFAVSSIEELPSEEEVTATARRLVDELDALLKAPVVEPYIGPAILVNRASGVFFHEIFGHRIEGHRQKSETEGQTFTKKVGQQILPDFISVTDDPTISRYAGVDLRGHYSYDDEGIAAQRTPIVENGVLKNFLTSRSPIQNYPASNGHGRRQNGYEVVSRQGNLIIESGKTAPFPRLREMLIEQCLLQGKPYGLIFADISGGFTMTGRYGPQAFKVKPLLVYRVYTDGRPDEPVRGVDIVGTPLTAFSKIILTGDDPGVFNGTCGAESGMVPVSASSPSVLVSEIEVEKQQKGQEKPPILPVPLEEAGQ